MASASSTTAADSPGSSCWGEDVLPLLADTTAQDTSNIACGGAKCGFCRGSCPPPPTAASRPEHMSCERCRRTFHRHCVQSPPYSRGGRRNEVNDLSTVDEYDALMADDAFVCGFCVPVAHSSASCALCHQPPHTSGGRQAPLVGPFYVAGGASCVYVHPQCAWWSNHFPWHELASAPSCLRCAGCSGPNASVRCTGCVRKGSGVGMGVGRFGSCRKRYHYSCAAAAGLLQPGLQPQQFLCDGQHFSPAASLPVTPHAEVKTAELLMSPSGKKRRRAGEGEGELAVLEREREALRQSVEEKQRLYAKVYAERAELVERLDLMADRAQQAQERAAVLDAELEQLRHSVLDAQAAAAAREERLHAKLAARKHALALAQSELAVLREQKPDQHKPDGEPDDEGDEADKRGQQVEEEKAELRDQLAEAEEELTQVRLEKEEVERKLGQALRHVDELREQTDKMQEDLDEREWRIEELSLTRDETQDQLHEAALQRQLHEEQHQQLRHQHEALQQQHEALLRDHKTAHQRRTVQPDALLTHHHHHHDHHEEEEEEGEGEGEEAQKGACTATTYGDHTPDRQEQQQQQQQVQRRKAHAPEHSHGPLKDEAKGMRAEWEEVRRERQQEERKVAALLQRMALFLARLDDSSSTDRPDLLAAVEPQPPEPDLAPADYPVDQEEHKGDHFYPSSPLTNVDHKEEDDGDDEKGEDTVIEQESTLPAAEAAADVSLAAVDLALIPPYASDTKESEEQHEEEEGAEERTDDQCSLELEGSTGVLPGGLLSEEAGTATHYEATQPDLTNTESVGWSLPHEEEKKPHTNPPPEGEEEADPARHPAAAAAAAAAAANSQEEELGENAQLAPEGDASRAISAAPAEEEEDKQRKEDKRREEEPVRQAAKSSPDGGDAACTGAGTVASKRRRRGGGAKKRAQRGGNGKGGKQGSDS